MDNLKHAFIDIFSDARDVGLRSFESLIDSNPKLLAVNREMFPEEMHIYEKLTEEERKKFDLLLKYFLQLSFVALMEKLELGEGHVSFHLTAHDDTSGESAELISAAADLELRNEFDRPSNR